jgi:hypothetical protein
MNWAATERARFQVLWRIHLLLVALRSDARRRRDCDGAVRAIQGAIEALVAGGVVSFEASLQSSPWSGANWTGLARAGTGIVDAVLAERFVHALLAGLRSAVGAPADEVQAFADAMEYIPAALCHGGVDVLIHLDDPEEASALVRVVAARLGALP